MTPEMRVRITAQNDSARGFDGVVRDAVSASHAVEASGRRAGTAMVAYGNSTRMAAAQQRNLVFQLNDVAVSLASGMNPMMVAMQQGSQIATIYGPEEGGVGRAFSEAGNMAVGFAKKLWPLGVAAAAVGVTIAGVTHEINKTAKTSVSMGDVVLGAFDLLGDSIMKELQPVFTWLGGIWDQITPGIATGVNWLIGAFVGAYDSIKATWSMLPSALGDMVFTAAQGVMDGLIWMVREGIVALNGFLTDVNGLTGKAGLPPIGLLDKPDYVKFDNPFAGAGGDMADTVGGAFSKAMGTDWVGEIGKRAEAIALLNKETEKAGGSTKRLNDEYSHLKDDGIEGLIKKAQELASTLSSSLTDGVMSIWKAFREGGNVLDAIGAKLLDFGDQLLSAGIQGLLQSAMGGFGGGWNIPTGFQAGGFFPAFPKFANGGIADRPSIFGEGSMREAAVPLPDGRSIPVSLRGGGTGSDSLHVTVGIEVINGNLMPTMARVAGEVAGKVVDQRAPLAVAKAQSQRKFG